MQKRYRLFVDGKEAGIFNQKDVFRMTGISITTIVRYAASGRVYKGKYRIVEITQPKKSGDMQGEIWEKKRLLAEYNWDRIRFSLNPRAKGWKEYAET